MSFIPIIDLAPSFAGPAGFAACAAAIAEACRGSGFFGVTGHGVPAGLPQRTVAAARALFALPLEDKLAFGRERPELNRGYIGFGAETLARLGGRETPPDFKEVFTVGPESYRDAPYYTCEAARPHWGPNRWPQPPGIRSTVLAYWDAMQGLKQHLLRLFAHALEVPADFFETRTRRSPDQLRLIHYPHYAQPWQPGQLRAGEHTDLGVLTILHSDNNRIGGLEVRNVAGEWVAAPEFDGFMVNIGDLMMRWCNDQWKSTPHRVANPALAAGEAADRVSLAYFATVDYDTTVACLPSCCGEARPPAYPPITMGEYRAKRFASTANR